MGKPTTGLMPDAAPALAPAGFGTFLNDLPAATSTISAFGRAAGAFVGHPRDPGGHPVTINRLRGLASGNGGLAGDTTTPFFAAGPSTEADGLSAPSRISANEQVAVGEATVGGLWHAFRWTAATGMVDLGTLGGPESGAFAVNGDGSVIVGSALTSQSTGSDHAFRWTAKTGMQDLTKLVNVPQHLILQSVIGVSADGTVITGNGFNTRLGMDEPWRAVLPLP